jgi:hypothetical protein
MSVELRWRRPASAANEMKIKDVKLAELIKWGVILVVSLIALALVYSAQQPANIIG